MISSRGRRKDLNQIKTSLGQVWWVTAILILWKLKQEGRDFKASRGDIARPHLKTTNQPTSPPTKSKYLGKKKTHEKLHPHLPTRVKAWEARVSLLVTF